MAGEGLVVMRPTSISHTGTDASITANGGVSFTATTQINVNGVFTSAHKNYLLAIQATSTGPSALFLQYRVGGVSDTGSNYTFQYIGATTTVSVVRSTSTHTRVLAAYGLTRAGSMTTIYGPAIAASTALRSLPGEDTTSAGWFEFAGTHSLTTAYDGFTLNSEAPENHTGVLYVYGFEE